MFFGCCCWIFCVPLPLTSHQYVEYVTELFVLVIGAHDTRWKILIASFFWLRTHNEDEKEWIKTCDESMKVNLSFSAATRLWLYDNVDKKCVFYRELTLMNDSRLLWLLSWERMFERKFIECRCQKNASKKKFF